MALIEKRLRHVALFVFFYLCSAMILAALRWNVEFLFYGFVVCGLIISVIFIDKRVQFSTPVLWGLAFWGCIHLAGGLLPISMKITDTGKTPVLYNMRLHPLFPRFDQWVHAFGYGISAVAVYEALCAKFKTRLALDIGLFFILVLTTVGLGTMNEIIEFIAVLLLPQTNVGDYFNTGWDLISNMIGSILATAYLKFSNQAQLKGSKSPIFGCFSLLF